MAVFLEILRFSATYSQFQGDHWGILVLPCGEFEGPVMARPPGAAAFPPVLSAASKIRSGRLGGGSLAGKKFSAVCTFFISISDTPIPVRVDFKV